MTDRTRRLRLAGRAVTATATVSALVAALAACTTLPGETPPQAVSSYAPVPDGENLPGPDDKGAPDLMLRDFYIASTHPGNDRQAAKEFLTSSAEDDWEDTQSTRILDRLDISPVGAADSGTRKYLVRGTVVGQLGTRGVYQPENTPYQEEVTLKQKSDGGWRIDDLPDGVVLDRSDFQGSYEARDLYFLDPTKKYLVPDRRWVYSHQENVGFSLVSLLGGGPRGPMEKAVEPSFPEGDGVQTSVDEDGTFTVDLTGIADQSVEDRKALAAQIVWTLADSDVRGPYRILADGAAIADDGREEWTIEDVADYDPSPDSAGLTQAVRDGSVLNVDDDSAEPVSGWASSNVAWANTSDRTGRIAAVMNKDDDSQELLVGKPDEDPVTLTEAQNLTTPSWSADGRSLYVVADGLRVLKFNVDGDGPEMEETRVEASSLDGLDTGDGRISVFNVSRDGTRAVVLINRRTFVVPILRDSTLRLGQPTEVGHRLGGTAQHADWRDDGSLIIGADDQEAPVWTVTSDGSEAVQLSSRNLTGVARVASAGSKLYVLDESSVWQLDQEDSETKFWREVPALQGTRAIPIVPR